jgi:AMP nucleosidase
MDESGEIQIAHQTLERYSGSPVEHFQRYLLLTNFPFYVDYFAESRGVPVHRGSMFTVAHSPKEGISILDIKVGSPAAALAADLCSRLNAEGALLLGMCAGLRAHYKIGEYFVPVAAIRRDGTSDFYFPAEVPALGNFVVQSAVRETLIAKKAPYHLGITYTTNIRLWEFDDRFKLNLRETRAQALEMECATLFAASYKRALPMGALLLISDLPLTPGGIKTKELSKNLFSTYTAPHVEMGIQILHHLRAQ